jgi:Fe-S cluster assembly scaffold protein SufB
MSRGISKIDADKMLIKGFFNEIINDSSWNIIHDNVADIIDSKYTNISKGK